MAVLHPGIHELFSKYWTTGGLASATFLTLFVIPQFYAYFDSIQLLLARLINAVTRRKAPAFTLE
jgi:hypothetical protein